MILIQVADDLAGHNMLQTDRFEHVVLDMACNMPAAS
jgi:hypothetical protein